MRIPKALLATTVLASGAALVSALALAAPAQAADLKPKGSALVGISGGTATAKALTNHRYTLTFPQEASIAWFGPAVGKGSTPKVGAFTPKKLEKGWTALGHRARVGVAASLEWQVADGSTSIVVLASDPKVREDGTLKITVFTKEALPAALPGYLLTVTHAAKKVRGFPLYGTNQTVSGSVVVSSDATAADASQGRMMYGSTKCFTYSHSVSNKQTYPLPVVAGASCNGVTVNDGSTVKISKAAPGQCGSEYFSLKLGTGKSQTTMGITSLTWDVNGNAVSPGQTCP